MLSIRPATIEDAAVLIAMIRELAAFEHLEHEMGMTEKDFERDGFGPRPKMAKAINRIREAGLRTAALTKALMGFGRDLRKGRYVHAAKLM